MPILQNGRKVESRVCDTYIICVELYSRALWSRSKGCSQIGTILIEYKEEKGN